MVNVTVSGASFSSDPMHRSAVADHYKHGGTSSRTSNMNTKGHLDQMVIWAGGILVSILRQSLTTHLSSLALHKYTHDGN